MKKELKNIDEIFKQAFDEFEADVDPSIWNNIQNALDSSTDSTTETTLDRELPKPTSVSPA
ncbi:MAG: hypothetical protein COB15_11870 [Flavobacteriales bacterium]|nr:MAG: hypothetical protein COB15_11870 [Flavobacteriales bacterium]